MYFGINRERDEADGHPRRLTNTIQDRNTEKEIEYNNKCFQRRRRRTVNNLESSLTTNHLRTTTD